MSKKKHTHLAKISRPRSQDVYLRKRLFSRLDNNRKNPVIWVCGPAGSGKTTLVNSYIETINLQSLWYQVDSGDGDPATFFHYLGLAAKKATPRKRRPFPHLTPEYLMGIPIFTRRFFEELYGRLTIPCLVVFDNYHEVPDDSLFHEVMRDGLGETPEGINVIIISRREPPPIFERLRANQLMSVISWNDIRLNLSEFKGMVSHKGLKKMSNEMIRELHAGTEGWIAGLMLILEKSKEENITISSLDTVNPEITFDYFANEIFHQIDKETQGILVKTALLPSITPAMVKRLTGIHQGDRILYNLSRNNFFIERKQSQQQIIYQYHAMFKQFLLLRAEELFTPKQLIKLKNKAAKILEESDRIEDAAVLFIETRDWESLARLINNNAKQFSLNGRAKTLLAWFQEFPRRVISNNPWLSYRFGECNLFLNTTESITHYERAFSLFHEDNDPEGMIFTICGALRSISFEYRNYKQYDRWIEELDKFKQNPNFMNNQILQDYVTSNLFFPLALRQPEHPDFSMRRERVHEILGKNVDVNLRAELCNYLAIHYILSGDFINARIVIELHRDLSRSKHATPPVVIMKNVAESHYYFANALHEQCIGAVEKGLQKGNYSGIHLWDNNLLGIGASNLLSNGELEKAKNYLNQIAHVTNPLKNFDGGFYHLLMGWYFLLKRDLPLAAKYMEKSYRLACELGAVFPEAISNLGLAQVLNEKGECQKAYVYLEDFKHLSDRMKNKNLHYCYYLARSQFAFDKCEDKKGIVDLHTAMIIGRENGYFNFLLWRPDVMINLCMKALTEGIETDYVKRLIRKRNLFPEKPPLGIEDWPWPLKIYTLGRFQIVKDEKTIQFSRKAPQKLMAMLKVLIVFGGNDVSESRISDVLWPDSDGDDAYHAFTTTLSRLRKLIGVDKAITLHEGRLSLNPRYCWVDIWAFERLLEKTDKVSGDSNKHLHIQMMEKAVDMYHCNFLADDEEEPWTISLRERLRNRFTRCLSTLGSYWEGEKQFEKAIDYYNRGLEVNDLTEGFYQNLMVCYHKLGRNAEAFGVYKRLKKVLSATSGLNPSQKTEHILDSISHK